MNTDSMTGRSKLLIGLIVVAVVFLLGFLPQYLDKRRLDNELRTANERITALEVDLRLAELRDLSGMILLEVLRQNFGLAQGHSTPYFERLRQVMEDSADASLRDALQALLAERDSITAALARNDPASLAEVQALYESTHRATN